MAEIDVSEFSTKKTDYIVINWDNSKYRYVQNSDVIYCLYYLNFWGEVYSVEEKGNFCWVSEGVRAVDIDLKSYIRYDTWKWSEVTEIYCMIVFELEPVNGEQVTEIYANYYHCAEDVNITGVSVSPDGATSVTWNINTTYNPIWGSSDYIWD